MPMAAAIEGEMRRGILILSLTLWGCADTSTLMYGRYLLNEGRYAEAYPYLEAAARDDDAESRHAFRSCAALWAAGVISRRRRPKTYSTSAA